MRQLLLLIVSLMLVTGSVVATLGTVELRDFELRGYVNPTKQKEIPFTVPRPGVNVELLQYSDDELRTNLEQMQDAHFRWVRQIANWNEIEPNKGEFDWSGWDRLAAALAEYPQLEPVVVLMNTPAWARVLRDGEPLTETAPPRHLPDFAAFAAAFAARYGDLVDYYQIWDEPNLADAWGTLDPRPAEYVAMLSAARDAIKGADATATIIAAGLAPTTETAGPNISDIRYLRAMYAQGAGALMDVVAGKPYGFFTSPVDRRVDETILNFSRIIALREVMVENNDALKPLWASNYGWNALPDNWSGEASIWGSVSEAEQIQFSLQALDRAHREWPWLGAMFLYHWQPDVAENSAKWGFSLKSQDGSASALLNALRGHQYPERAQNGLYHALNRHARYSGVWQFSERGADIGWLPTSDSQLELDFYGQDLAMLLREDDYIAFLYPTVDGQAANATQIDAGGIAYILLRSNSLGPELNLEPVAADLRLGPHSLHAVADHGWDRWAIAGYAVSSGDLSAPYNRQIALGIVASGLSLVVFLISVATAPWREWLPPLALLVTGVSATTHLILTGITSIFMMLAMLWTWDSPKAIIFLRDEVNIVLALITGGLLYLSPTFLLSLVFALVLFVLVYHRLESGLILILLFSPYFLFPVSLHTYAFPMVEVMLLITAAAGFVRLLVALGTRLQMDNSAYPVLTRKLLENVKSMDWAVLCMLVIALMSLLWTEQAQTAQTELRTLIIEPVIFYLLIRGARIEKKTLFRLFAALVLAAVVVSVIGLFKYIRGDIITSEADTIRLLSVYGSPNNVGLLLGRAMPIALALLFSAIDTRIRRLAAGSLLILLPTLLLTQSVGGILLGVPVGLAVVLVGHFRRRAFAPLAVIAVIGAAGFALLTRLSARFANILDFSGGTNFVRLRLWESALAMIRDNPITGIGLDQFLYQFGGKYLRPDAIWDRELSHPHNFILDIWTRLSLFGLVVFFLIQFLFWRGTSAVLSHVRQHDPLLYAMTLGLMGSMAALLAHGLIDNSIFVIDLAFIFMFQLAAAVRLTELTQQLTEATD